MSKTNKNDANDAEAICEAMSRPSMRFVPIKTVEQQDLQAPHRIRTELIHQRTAKVNQTRGLLGEYGVVVAPRVNQLRKALPEILEDAENGLTARFKILLDGLLHVGEVDVSDQNLSDLVGEIANTLSGNARAHFGADFMISVPVVVTGNADAIQVPRSVKAYILPMRWHKQDAVLVVSLQ